MKNCSTRAAAVVATTATTAARQRPKLGDLH